MMGRTPLDIIYEDNHLLVVNKPSGMLVQGDVTGDIPLVEIGKEYIKGKYDKPGAVFLGVVHRLDRPVSGIVVLARTSKALERMNALFRNKKTVKTYWAIVDRRPANPEGTLIHWLTKDEKKNRAAAYIRETSGALRSELHYRTLAEVNGSVLLEVRPVTGRPHQIRVQLSTMRCPITGDVKYGHRNANDDGSICLHARRLEFTHPVKNELLRLEAALPQSAFWKPFLDVND